MGYFVTTSLSLTLLRRGEKYVSGLNLLLLFKFCSRWMSELYHIFIWYSWDPQIRNGCQLVFGRAKPGIWSPEEEISAPSSTQWELPMWPQANHFGPSIPSWKMKVKQNEHKGLPSFIKALAIYTSWKTTKLSPLLLRIWAPVIQQNRTQQGTEPLWR